MTDAVGGNVTIRALVSARDAPTLWDLRCLTRESLVRWIREQKATPRTRANIDADSDTTTVAVIPHLSIAAPPGSDRFFSGDPGSRARGASFGGPDEGDEDRADAGGQDGAAPRD